MLTLRPQRNHIFNSASCDSLCGLQRLGLIRECNFFIFVNNYKDIICRIYTCWQKSSLVFFLSAQSSFHLLLVVYKQQKEDLCEKKGSDLCEKNRWAYILSDRDDIHLPPHIRSRRERRAAQTNFRVKALLTVALTYLWSQSDDKRHCHIAVSSGKEL